MQEHFQTTDEQGMEQPIVLLLLNPLWMWLLSSGVGFVVSNSPFADTPESVPFIVTAASSVQAFSFTFAVNATASTLPITDAAFSTAAVNAACANGCDNIHQVFPVAPRSIVTAACIVQAISLNEVLHFL